MNDIEKAFGRTAHTIAIFILGFIAGMFFLIGALDTDVNKAKRIKKSRVIPKTDFQKMMDKRK